jgi:hypothetical protein
MNLFGAFFLKPKLSYFRKSSVSEEGLLQLDVSRKTGVLASVEEKAKTLMQIYLEQEGVL